VSVGTEPALRHPTAPARLVLALERQSRPVLVLVAWGIVIGIVGALALIVITPADWPIQSSRSGALRDSLTMLNHGGPLLLGRHGATGKLYAVGSGDDLGIYVYLPWLAHVFGTSDPVHLIRFAYAVMFGLTAALYPLWFRRLTGSMLAALVAPIVVLFCARSLGYNDIYWLPAWGSLTLVPPLLVLAKTRGRWAWLWLIVIAFVAGWLQSMRSESGLGAAVSAVIVLFMLRLRWWRVILVLAAMALAYVSISSFLIPSLEHHRDHVAGVNLTNGETQAHPFWHPMYLGLGYLPNDYGIRFNDTGAANRVQRDAPGTVYLSQKYESVLRKAYFKTVGAHPLAVLGQYAAKAWVTLADTAPYLLLIALTLPMLLRRARRRDLWLWLLLIAPTFVLTFVPTLVAIPFQVYEEGLYATVGLIAILGIGLLVAEFSELLAEAGALGPALRQFGGAITARLRSPASRPSLAAAGVLVALIVLVGTAHIIRRDAERWQGSSSGVLIDRVPSPLRVL
jgi:hypothetical protein